MEYAFAEKDLQCPVCCGILNVPVTLNCKHSFCITCIQTHWKHTGSQQCPVCRCKESSSRPPINLALKIASDLFKKKAEETLTKSADRCSIHNEELVLFCRKDAELICVACAQSRSHINHDYCPIAEASQEILEELIIRYNPVKKQLNGFEKLKKSLEELEAYLQNQADETSAEMKEEYEKLHALLREEEAARLMVLQDDRNRKTKEVRERLEEINKHIKELHEITNYIEPIITADDVTFLKECKEAIKRTGHNVPEPEYPSGALIDVGQYLGSIKYGAWKRLQRFVNHWPVIFDPNTAHPNLIISDELTTIQYGKKLQLPDNPERFMSRMGVLAASGFSSGRHYWDVDVRDSREWYIGVARESIRRKSAVFLNPTEGFWVIGLENEDSYWAQTSPRTRLTMKKKPQRIRVELDYEKGKVSFSNSADGSGIYTFKDKFTEKIFPFFATGLMEKTTLRICAR